LLPDEIYAKDLQSRFIVTNKAVAKIRGVAKPEDLIGKSDFDIFPYELAKKYYDEEQLLIHSDQPIVNQIIRTPEGGWFSSSKIPWRDKDGKIMGLVGINRDIFEQKMAEAAIQANEEKFRSIFEKSPVGIEIYESNGKLIDANPASLEIFGCRDLKDIQGLDLFDNPNFSDAIKDDLRHGKVVKREVVYDFEKVKKLNRFFTEKNGTIYLDILMTPFNSAINQLATGFLIILKDITEHKKMETELIKASKLESLGILAGGIAHDFNNILTAIIGNIHLAKMNLEKDLESFEILNEAEMAASRASELTQQLLTFSKGGLPIKKTASITELIHETVRFVFRGSNIRCEFRIPQNLWLAPIDAGQISQVMNNLAINALQAMPEGGTVVAGAENVQIHPDSMLPLPPGNYVKVSLQDQGIGIPGHILPKVFDPYFTTKPKGSGLGLAICYSIISKHKGHIFIESEAGSGTIVRFYLPAVPDAALSLKSEPEQKFPGDGRILVMDDELIVRQVLGKLLIRFGYQVDFAKEGNEAIELFKKAKNENQSYILIIMDLTVPGGMGGKETMKALLMIDSTVKAIVSSGYFNDPIMANFQDYGFKGFISKPYKMKELQNIIFKVTNPNDNVSNPSHDGFSA
jgi:PAS domain S-box-containing protein